MRHIGIVFLILLLAACQSYSDKDTPPFKLNSSLEGGALILSVNDKIQLLNEEGDIVNFYTSADKKSIVLEVEKLSTLSILKVYKWNLFSEKYVADSTNINKVAWQTFAQSHTIKLEELESSHVYFLKWKGKDSMVVELRGHTGMGIYISEAVELKY